MQQTRRLVRTVVTSILLASPTFAAAQTSDPDPTRFEEQIETFASYDTHNTVPLGEIVFVGSSSIRFWPTAERFPGLTVINRGFGGSHISDVNHYVEETVLKYAPELVVFYAGDNDISAGKTPERVFSDYRAFVDRVLADNPRTQILFIGVKPSIRRWELWPQMVELNRLVQEYSADHLNLHYSDVATPMLRGGDPDEAHFVSDGLHLSELGYDIWTETVGRSIAKILD